jgi:hypothetical protein
MTIRHLESDFINEIALGLDEDVYGANGDLDEVQITERVIENIHDFTGDSYREAGLIPVAHVARLIQSVWEYMDRKRLDEIVHITRVQETISPNT